MAVGKYIGRDVGRTVGKSLFRLGTNLNLAWLSFFNTYKSRVTADSGSVENDANSKTVFQLLYENTTWADWKIAIMPEAGKKIRTSGVEEFHTKDYDFTANNNDAAQTTEASQAFVGGRIAPNELENAKSVTGQTKTFSHSDIVVLGTYTIVQVINAENDATTPENSGKTVVKFTEVSSGTYNSISWTGKLFFYGIYAGTIANQTEIETGFLNLFKPIANVTIGTQTWATSNFEAVATPMGNVIKEMQSASAVEKVTNVGFEGTYAAGVAPNWILTRGNASENTTTPYLGGSSQNITNPAGNTGLINQGIANVVVGRWYYVSVWAKNIAGSGGRIQDPAGAHFIFDINSVSWTHYSLYFKATSGSVYKGIFANSDAVSGVNSISVDEFSIKELGWADSQELYDGLIAQGESVQTALEAAAMWSYHNNDTAIGAIYGKIFNGATRNLLVADVATKADWDYHVATEAEWTALLANEEVTLKKEGDSYWFTTGGTNTTEFSALGGASRNADGTFGTIKEYVSFWCGDSDKIVKIYHDGTAAEIVAADLNEGAYIRLVKD